MNKEIRTFISNCEDNAKINKFNSRDIIKINKFNYVIKYYPEIPHFRSLMVFLFYWSR